jgi:hypothetical protein
MPEKGRPAGVEEKDTGAAMPIFGSDANASSGDLMDVVTGVTLDD